MTGFFTALARTHRCMRARHVLRPASMIFLLVIVCGCTEVLDVSQQIAGAITPETDRRITGPTTAENFPQLVAQAVPFYAGTVVVAAEGNWFPDAGEIRGSLTVQPVPGVIAVTTESVLFMQWQAPANRYRLLRRVQFAELMDAFVDSFLANTRVVLKIDDMFDATPYDSFDFTTQNGYVLHNDRVAEAADYIKTHFASGGTSAPIPGMTLQNVRVQHGVLKQIEVFENGQGCEQWRIANTEVADSSQPDRLTERWIVDRCDQRINYLVTFFAPGASPVPGTNISVRLEN